MTRTRTSLATAAVALLAWLGASVALGSAPVSTDARKAATTSAQHATGNAGQHARDDASRTAVAVVQAPSGASRPDAADVRAATAAARRLAPGAPVDVVTVTSTSDAQTTVARLAAQRPEALLVGAGPATAGALTAAREAWPQLRTATTR